MVAVQGVCIGVCGVRFAKVGEGCNEWLKMRECEDFEKMEVGEEYENGRVSEVNLNGYKAAGRILLNSYELCEMELAKLGEARR
ncbi:hypothetical protein RYX36_032191 [Vicia faba]